MPFRLCLTWWKTRTKVRMGLFSRYYANTLASFIANSNPKIRQVFESWKNLSPDALLSNLEKNQELKAVLLNETPWVMEAKNETERKKRIALLFDLNRMANEQQASLAKLQQIAKPQRRLVVVRGHAR